MKIKNKNVQVVDNFVPTKHKGLICTKCGMSSMYAIVKCWNCAEPFKPKKDKGETNE